jgi:hypothetical protein
MKNLFLYGFNILEGETVAEEYEYHSTSFLDDFIQILS